MKTPWARPLQVSVMSRIKLRVVFKGNPQCFSQLPFSSAFLIAFFEKKHCGFTVDMTLVLIAGIWLMWDMRYAICDMRFINLVIDRPNYLIRTKPAVALELLLPGSPKHLFRSRISDHQ